MIKKIFAALSFSKLSTDPSNTRPGHDSRSLWEARQAKAVRAFNTRARELGYADVQNYFWYHTVDLGDGLITPGGFDYRAVWPEFGFPADMRGLHVLDIGSATGYFAFEFEKRGADVVATEVPSIAALDSFPGESLQDTLKKIEEAAAFHSVLTAEQRDFLFRKCSPDEL